MSKELRVTEKYSKYWPAVTFGSLLISAGLFAAFIYADDLLLESYLRLGAFAFFVIGFLSYFKLRDGQMTIHYTLEKDRENILQVTYSADGNTHYEESIDLDDVTEIKTDDMPNRSLYNDFYKRDKSVRFKKRHMDGWLYLNELHGRVIPLSEENAKSIVTFINSQRS